MLFINKSHVAKSAGQVCIFKGCVTKTCPAHCGPLQKFGHLIKILHTGEIAMEVKWNSPRNTVVLSND